MHKIISLALLAGLFMTASTGRLLAADSAIKLSTTDGSTKMSFVNAAGAEVASVNSLGDATFTSVSSTSSVVSYRLLSDSTSITATLGTTGMSFLMAASENWSFEFNLQTGCNNAAGSKWGLDGPAGATLMAVAVGMNNAVNTRTSAIITAFNTATIAFNAVNSQLGWLRITGVVRNGVNPGYLTLQFQSTTNPNITTLKNNSYFVARKLQN